MSVPSEAELFSGYVLPNFKDALYTFGGARAGFSGGLSTRQSGTLAGVGFAASTTMDLLDCKYPGILACGYGDHTCTGAGNVDFKKYFGFVPGRPGVADRDACFYDPWCNSFQHQVGTCSSRLKKGDCYKGVKPDGTGKDFLGTTDDIMQCVQRGGKYMWFWHDWFWINKSHPDWLKVYPVKAREFEIRVHNDGAYHKVQKWGFDWFDVKRDKPKTWGSSHKNYKALRQVDSEVQLQASDVDGTASAAGGRDLEELPDGLFEVERGQLAADAGAGAGPAFFDEADLVFDAYADADRDGAEDWQL